MNDLLILLNGLSRSTSPERFPASEVSEPSAFPRFAASFVPAPLALLALLSGMSAFSQAPVNPSAVALTVSAASGPVTWVAAGTGVTLTASVAAGGKTLQTGIVRFCDALVAPVCTQQNRLATTQLTKAGTATYHFTPGPGSHSFTAVFEPQVHYNQWTSAASPLNVTTVGTTATTMTQAGSVGAYTLTAKVQASGNGALLPTGNVLFLDTSANNLQLGSVPLVHLPSSISFAASSFATGTISGYSTVTTADFNGDGKMDMAVIGANSQSMQILLGNGDGTFTAGPVTPIQWQGTYQIKSADFNQDGIADLALVNLDNSYIQILLGKGDGTFTSAPNAVSMNGANGITICDFNKDGIPDMIVANRYSDTVSFMAGKGDGTFTSGWDSYVNWQNPTAVISGDFNGDGNQDFAVNVLNGAEIAIYLGNGNGTFTQGQFIPVGNQPAFFAAGDFNNDGHVDLAVANTADNNVTILLGKGDGTFTTKQTFAAPAGTTDIAAADFNGDGNVDLVVSGNSANTVAYFMGNGDGTFTASSVVAVGAGPYGMALADFNNDGALDVAVADTSNNASVVLTHMTQGSTATLTGLSVPGTGLHAVDARYVGDLNFGTSTSATTSLTAKTVATSTMLYTSTYLAMTGQQVALTAGLSPYSVAPATSNGETVTFFCDGKAIGTAALLSGSATLNTTGLTVGLHVLSVSYGGDATLTGSTGYSVILVYSASGWFF